MAEIKIKAGKLLIAEPFMGDPNFDRSVILLCEINNKGAIGFVLNQTSQYKLGDLITQNLYPDITVDEGGPVQQNTLHYLHNRPDIIEGGLEIMKDLYWGGNFEAIIKHLNFGILKPNEIKFFMGYAGWGAGQLEKEIGKNSWILSNTNSETVMKPKNESFWRETLKKLGGDFKVIANYPIDPRMN
jgi:putative transcriptional regulator